MRLILLLSLLSLLVVSEAQANWPRVDRAKTIAAEYWGASPSNCPTVWTVKTERLPSYYKTPSPIWAMVADGAPFCVVYVRTSWYYRWAHKRVAWPWFCTTYAHEWGHLLGHDHSDDPNNIMYHTTTRTIKACRKEGTV